MSKEAIDLLEEAAIEVGNIERDEFPAHNQKAQKLIDQALTFLKQSKDQPTEFTKKVRLSVQSRESIIAKITDINILAIIGWIPQLCDRLDTSEQQNKELLGSCEKFIEWNEKYPSNTIYGHEAIIRIATELDEIAEQTKIAIAKAEKEG